MQKRGNIVCQMANGARYSVLGAVPVKLWKKTPLNSGVFSLLPLEIVKIKKRDASTKKHGNIACQLANGARSSVLGAVPVKLQ